VAALRSTDIGAALGNWRFAPRLFDLPAKGKVRALSVLASVAPGVSNVDAGPVSGSP
jgi:hypothetical protein